MEEKLVEKPKDESVKELIHTSGLPAPQLSQAPHHPPVIEPVIIEYPNKMEQDYEHKPALELDNRDE
jgi:hypothetical protein